MVINHNLQALNAQRQYNITVGQKKKSSEKLASGYKVNRAADDAAGLSMSEKMRRQIRGLSQASKNIQDGISLVQIADGALNEDHDILQRMNELAIQAANDTNTQEDRADIQREINALVLELDRIANSTTFNEDIYPLNHGSEMFGSDATGSGVLPASGIEYWNLPFQTIDLMTTSDGDYGDYTISNSGNSIVINGSGNYKFDNTKTTTDITINNDATITVERNVNQITVSEGRDVVILVPSLVVADGIHSIELKNNSSLTMGYSDDYLMNYSHPVKNIEMGNHTTLNFCANIDALNINKNSTASDRTINIYNDAIGRAGAMNVFDYISCDEMNIMGECRVQIGPDVSSEEEIPFPVNYSSGLVSTTVSGRHDNKAFIDLLVGYSSGDSSEESDNKDRDGIWIQAGADEKQGMMIYTVDARPAALGISNLSVMSHKDAGKTIESVKQALEKVSSYRSYFGATQNRLEHAMAIDDNIVENTQYSESRIRDTDMAEEMMRFSMQSILEQAGTTVLTQANQTNQAVLGLLQ